MWNHIKSIILTPEPQNLGPSPCTIIIFIALHLHPGKRYMSNWGHANSIRVVPGTHLRCNCWCCQNEKKKKKHCYAISANSCTLTLVICSRNFRNGTALSLLKNNLFTDVLYTVSQPESMHGNHSVQREHTGYSTCPWPSSFLLILHMLLATSNNWWTTQHMCDAYNIYNVSLI